MKKSDPFFKQLLLHSCLHIGVVLFLLYAIETTFLFLTEPWRNISNADVFAQNREVYVENQKRLECKFVGPLPGFIPGCGPNKHCVGLSDKEEAVRLCKMLSWCHGITIGEMNKYELRGILGAISDSGILQSSVKGEISFRKHCYDTEQSSEPASFGYEFDDPDAEIDSDWENPSEEDYDKVGFDIEGKSSIFVNVASYRDGMCQATIESAIERAKYPNRLVFGIVEQNYWGDDPCVPDCSSGSPNSQDRICKHISQIRLFRILSVHSQGPTWARHRSDRLYRGETYRLQIDAHMVFVRDWDEKLIGQWLSTGNEFAILSSYPTEVAGSINGVTGESLITTVPVICGADPVGNDGIVRNQGAGERNQMEEPMLQPFWAAGLSFSRGHLTLRVPYDCCTPMLFTGEEFAFVLRSWTHGYDVYALNESVIFHYYPGSRLSHPPLFWENQKQLGGARARYRSTNRLRILLDLTGSTHSKIRDYDDTDKEKYGLGKVRPVSQFLTTFGIRVNQSKPVITNHCDKIMDGKLHAHFKKYLKRGSGIDYSKIPLNILDSIK